MRGPHAMHTRHSREHRAHTACPRACCRRASSSHCCSIPTPIASGLHTVAWRRCRCIPNLFASGSHTVARQSPTHLPVGHICQRVLTSFASGSHTVARRSNTRPSLASSSWYSSWEAFARLRAHVGACREYSSVWRGTRTVWCGAESGRSWPSCARMCACTCVLWRAHSPV